MKTLLPDFIKQIKISPDLAILLGTAAEGKGSERVFERTQPEVLNVLRQQAIISSVESSNRIEGVEIDPQRLNPLLTGKIQPQDRSEEEVFGYKNALEWINKNYDNIIVNPETICKLHELSQQGMISDAGKWKSKNNQIIEYDQNGKASIRFTPLEPELVESAIENLCLAYNDLTKNTKIPELLLIASFVFDFLCIHPFRDGNGRVSRLITHLLLLQHRYQLVRLISIERVIEETKDAYYESLKNSSLNWHLGKHEITYFWRYFIRVINISYEKLTLKLKTETSFEGAKTQLVRNTILTQLGKFRLSDLKSIEPGISEALIQKVLADLKKEGLIKLIGKGRGAVWVKC